MSILVMTAASAELKRVGYLRGLSSPSVTLSMRDADRLAEVVAGGANQVADVLNEEIIKAAERTPAPSAASGPAVEMPVDHFSVQMADAVGIDLADGSAAGGKAARIVIGFKVAHQGGDT